MFPGPEVPARPPHASGDFSDLPIHAQPLEPVTSPHLILAAHVRPELVNVFNTSGYHGTAWRRPPDHCDHRTISRNLLKLRKEGWAHCIEFGMVPGTMDTEKSRQMLDAMFREATCKVERTVESEGLSVDTLVSLQQQLIHTLIPVENGEIRCGAGCAYCCHLRVIVSIPEAIAIYGILKSCLSEEDLTGIGNKVSRLAETGKTGDNAWWLSTGNACAFLHKETHTCSIYEIRPFVCRSYHSLDDGACREGFHLKKEVDIPCFPLLKRSREIYSAALISTLEKMGLHSFRVEFASALNLLFQNESIIEKWFSGENVFEKAGIS